MSFRVVALCTLALIGSSACQREAATQAPPQETREATLRFVVVTHGQAADPFWSVVKRGVEDAAAQVGAQVAYRAPETFDVVQMARLVDAAVAAQPDGLALSLPDADALASPIARARAAGLNLVSMNSGAEVHTKLGVPVHVGQDEFEAGRRAGLRMREKGHTRALCVHHEVGNVALDRRCEGFSEGLGAEVPVVAVDMDPTSTKNRVFATLEKDPKIEAILALGPTAAMPTLAAVERAGRIESIDVATFDLSPEVLDELESGRLAFALDQQPYLQGFMSIVLLAAQARTGVLPANDILTGPAFVTADNARAVREGTKAGLR